MRRQCCLPDLVSGGFRSGGQVKPGAKWYMLYSVKLL